MFWDDGNVVLVGGWVASGRSHGRGPGGSGENLHRDSGTVHNTKLRCRRPEPLRASHFRAGGAMPAKRAAPKPRGPPPKLAKSSAQEEGTEDPAVSRGPAACPGVAAEPSASSVAAPAVVGLGVPREAAPPKDLGGPVSCPVLPPEDALDEGAWSVMRQVVPWCIEALRTKAFPVMGVKAVDPREQRPVDISANKDPGAATAWANYREPWSADRCKIARDTTGYYQAAANVAWLNPSLMGLHFPVQEPPLRFVLDIADRCFGQGAVFPGGGCVPPRLIFPFVMEAYVKDVKHLSAPTFKQSLNLVGGHAVLWAWWLALFRALSPDKPDVKHLAFLWECGLSMTVLVRVSADDRECCLASVRLSERFRQQHGLADTFVLFSRKVRALCPCTNDEEFSVAMATKLCADNDLRFNAAVANKTLCGAVKTLTDAMAADPKIAEALQSLEWKHGADVLSNSYNKLSRVCQICATATRAFVPGVSGTTFPTMQTFAVQLLCLDLDRKRAPAAWFTLSVLDKNKDGSAGWVQTACCKPAPQWPRIVLAFRAHSGGESKGPSVRDSH